MKKSAMKKMLSLLMVVAMICATSLSAFAAEPVVMPDLPEKAEKTVDEAGSQTIIPVNISAEATQLDVTVPTAFPIAADPTGETVTATDTIITNNSFGAIVVSNITVKDNATEVDAATWHLADYDTDMSLEKVDSNKVGLELAPQGGKNAADGTAFLKTDDSNDAVQVLLDTVDSKWVLDGQTDRDTDQLTVVYNANVSAVSETITNETVANIVITVAWYTTD